MLVCVPDYYKEFNCIADKCRHTCCQGWEVEVDKDSLARFKAYPDIMEKIDFTEESLEDGKISLSACFRLSDDEVCPFLNEKGLCEMILKYGEDILCQTCTDHPRFRNYWEDRIEMGLGMVCEEAARLILGQKEPMKIVVLDERGIENDGAEVDGIKADGSGVSESARMGYDGLPEDEKWLMELRDDMLSTISLSMDNGPIARLKEYLIYRHIPDALYDDRLEERVEFIERAVQMISDKWEASDGKFDTLVEIVRQFSYDVEYDEDVKEKYLQGGSEAETGDE